MIVPALVPLLCAAAGAGTTGITIAADIPLRVAIERRFTIRREGQPIEGRLTAPVYVFDRLALPAGMLVKGHIAEIRPLPARRRITAYLAGDLSPSRDVRAAFDSVVLPGGSSVAIQTASAAGTAHHVHVTTKGAGTGEGPGRLSRLRARLAEMVPYRKQAWRAGTVFVVPLARPAVVPDLGLPATNTEASNGTQEFDLRARLLSPLSSRTARPGTRVEAIVTEPVFSNGQLAIPEGARISGEVIGAQQGRFLHRPGRLHFVFRGVRLSPGTAGSIQGYLAETEADFDSHLALDAEGGLRVKSPKSRFVFPAIASAVAGLSLHQDVNAKGVPDQDIVGRAESGAVGLGLVGTILAQTSRVAASTIAFYGAGYSVYSTFIARGPEVSLPANSPLTVRARLRSR